jgi:protein involved in temperature-dependent protein secretion
VVGRRDPDPTVPVPVYRVSDSSKNTTYIQDVDGHIRREASADEVRHLFSPVTYSAAAFQKAVNQLARHGALEARFHPMLPDWEYCEQTLLTSPPFGASL